jgi:hypothetical protein
MSWYVGQQVSVLRESGIFIIQEILKTQLVLTDEFGFSYTYTQDLVVARQAIDVQKIKNKDQINSARNQRQKPSTTKENALPSIDLHAEELGLPAQLPAHDVLLAQLSAFRLFCNRQARARQAKFLIIHGAGEGRLKQEIRQLVLSRNGMSMHDAQWSNGAVGTSRIELILNAFVPF